MTDAFLLIIPTYTCLALAYVARVLFPRRREGRILNAFFWLVCSVALATGWWALTEIALTFVPSFAFIEQRTIRAVVGRTILAIGATRLWWEFR